MTASDETDLIERLLNRRFPGKWSDELINDPLSREAVDALRKLRRELDAAREALKPFAEYVTELESHYNSPLPDSLCPSPSFPLSDFRKARAALTERAT